MDLHAYVTIVADERTEGQLAAGFQEGGAGDIRSLRRAGQDVRDAVTDDDLGPLLVEGQDLRVLDDCRVGYALEGADKDGHAVRDDADVQALA
jgi:hypothetical protein